MIVPFFDFGTFHRHHLNNNNIIVVIIIIIKAIYPNGCNARPQNIELMISLKEMGKRLTHSLTYSLTGSSHIHTHAHTCTLTHAYTHVHTSLLPTLIQWLPDVVHEVSFNVNMCLFVYVCVRLVSDGVRAYGICTYIYMYNQTVMVQ